jgi:hypothetical protein
MPHGGARPGSGRKSIFGRKALKKPVAMDFSEAGWVALRGLQRRQPHLSRNAIIGWLALQYADKLTFDAKGVVFPQKARRVLSIRVPATVRDALRRARRRTGKNYSDLGEALVRQYGHTASFPSVPSS